MKFKFLIKTVVLLFISVVTLAQKSITPDIQGLNLHLSSFKNFDQKTKQLLANGYEKINWPIATKNKGLNNTAFKLVADSMDNIIEIIHSADKQVFEVNVYVGYADVKWKTFTKEQQMNVGKNMFFNFRNLINKEFGTDEKGQRKVWGNYKEADYTIAENFLKGLDDQKLGYFASWGPFMESPIELENYSAKYVMVTVTDPKAMIEYYKTKK